MDGQDGSSSTNSHWTDIIITGEHVRPCSKSPTYSEAEVISAGTPTGGKPGHRKTVSDTFAFMAGKDEESGASGSGTGKDDDAEDGLYGPDGDDKDDPKKAKRIMANRQSAQRSRMRKLQYTSDLEKSVSRLHTEISQLNPQ
eukprot:scaffold107259_cov46-Prasinocladus_malaysianus.AAC.1